MLSKYSNNITKKKTVFFLAGKIRTRAFPDSFLKDDN